MEYNEQFKILFEKSILFQLFDAYKYDFEDHELVDDIYANTRTYVYGVDTVKFRYRNRSDYNKLIKYINSCI